MRPFVVARWPSSPCAPILPNNEALSPDYASIFTELLSVGVPRLHLPRQAGSASRDLVQDQVRVGWINFFDYPFTRKLHSGNAVGIKQDMYDSSPFAKRGRYRDM